MTEPQPLPSTAQYAVLMRALLQPNVSRLQPSQLPHTNSVQHTTARYTCCAITRQRLTSAFLTVSKFFLVSWYLTPHQLLAGCSQRLWSKYKWSGQAATSSVPSTPLHSIPLLAGSLATEWPTPIDSSTSTPAAFTPGTVHVCDISPSAPQSSICEVSHHQPRDRHQHKQRPQQGEDVEGRALVFAAIPVICGRASQADRQHGRQAISNATE